MEKETRVRHMFAGIARRYDLLNALLTARQDKRWRAFAVDQCQLHSGDRVIDVCTGTGEIANELARAVGDEGKIAAVDFCAEMMEVGREKMARGGLGLRVEFVQANAERLPFPDGAFAAATNGFAMRNVASMERALREMHRVVKPGGRVVVLEIAKPQAPIIRSLHRPYLYCVVPLVGRVVSGDGAAYRYLPNSLTYFPSRSEVLSIFAAVGLKSARCYDLSLGTATVFVGIKR